VTPAHRAVLALSRGLSFAGRDCRAISSVGNRPQRIFRRTGSMAKVEMYSTMWCPYCARARALLERKGVEFTEIDLMEQPGRRDEMIRRAGGRTTVPQIFIDGEHIGGCDDMVALDRAGKLDPKLGVGA
jgi:glutaredoxin 3